MRIESTVLYRYFLQVLPMTGILPGPALPFDDLLLNEFSEIEDATRWIPTDRAVVRAGKKHILRGGR